MLERGMKGFERGRNLEKLGMHSQDTAELFFDDVAVPVENLLGEEGEGFTQLVQNLPQERLSLAVSAVAAARYAFSLTLDYCGQRTAFGQTIGSFQNTRFVLAELATQIEVAESFIDNCVAELGRGEPVPRERHPEDGERHPDRDLVEPDLERAGWEKRTPLKSVLSFNKYDSNWGDGRPTS